MNRRDLGFGVAAALSVVGLLTAFAPAVDPGALVGEQGRSLLALGAVAGGLALLRRWYRTERRVHEPAERERLSPVDVAGGDVDELLELADARSEEVARFYRSQARERLTEVAVGVLTTHRDLDEAAAREQLASAAWTDDPVAARFFVAGADVAGPGGLSGRLGRESRSVRRARRAVAELRRIAGESAATGGAAPRDDGAPGTRAGSQGAGSVSGGAGPAVGGRGAGASGVSDSAADVSESAADDADSAASAEHGAPDAAGSAAEAPHGAGDAGPDEPAAGGTPSALATTLSEAVSRLRGGSARDDEPEVRD